ncbi:MAG TPA: RHS repeat-associated core domain-containing protein, partial [Myxococcota bacterium]|nr:RHS repeat-associated core domain-containing protein [Myxococcota bacterium]
SATPWAYDANNRLTKSPGFSARCYDADGNQTTTRSSGDCSTGMLVETLTWDATNRLSAYENDTTGADFTYRYDPFGRRIKKSSTSSTTFYLWDGDRLLAEYGVSGNRTVRYAYGSGFAPVQFARTDGSSEDIYDVHSDHLDTPRMLTDDAGVPSWRASYEAFGRAHVSTDPDGTPVTTDPGITFNLRFPGQYEDAESGLHYNRHRYYAPDVGRYISADPIGQFGMLAEDRLLIPTIPLDVTGSNIYQFASLNPLNKWDPDGLQSRTPAQGQKPNSRQTYTDGKGGQTVRDFGADGKASRDVDYGHNHGQGDPHAHDWDWNNPDNPRQPGRPLNDGEDPNAPPGAGPAPIGIPLFYGPAPSFLLPVPIPAICLAVPELCPPPPGC